MLMCASAKALLMWLMVDVQKMCSELYSSRPTYCAVLCPLNHRDQCKFHCSLLFQDAHLFSLKCGSSHSVSNR